MSFGVIIFLIIGGLSFFTLVLIVMYNIISKIIRRKDKDRPLVESHKFYLKSPTWRFQKYHPNRCPHHSGIYRKIEIKVLDNKVKKTIFVCADCIDAIEIEELEQRDKFKK